MIRTLTRTAIIMLLALFPLHAGAESGKVEMKTIKYDDYLETIVSVLPEIKANGINLLTQENALKKAGSLSDISLSGNGSYVRENQTLAYMGNASGKNSTSDLSLGLSKKIAPTGTDVGVDFGYSRTAMEDYSVFNNAYTNTPYAGVTVKQPLLYNFLGKVDQYGEKNAEMQVDIEKVKLIESNKSTLNAYKKLFFEWSLARRQIRNTEEALANSKLQRDQIAINYRAGLSDEDDYEKTAASVIEYERQLESDFITLNAIVNKLSVYLHTESVAPSEDDFNRLYQSSLQSDFGLVGFETTTSARIISMMMKRLLYSKGVYENRVLPELNVYGGVRQKNLASGSSDAFNELPYRDWNIGFEFSYKLGNTEAESSLKDIEIQVKSLECEKEIAVNDYKKYLSVLAGSANGTKLLIGKKTAYLDTLNRQLAAEMIKYRQGRLNLSYVIQTGNTISLTKTEIETLKYRLIAYCIDYRDSIQ
ncbi:MAG: hypothetical protein EPN93_12235 [Spirochaetes bacterium]|nr:MAG: hypothetical protein EPN93_12235 [Spirochaetota bacterium]